MDEWGSRAAGSRRQCHPHYDNRDHDNICHWAILILCIFIGSGVHCVMQGKDSCDLGENNVEMTCGNVFSEPSNLHSRSAPSYFAASPSILVDRKRGTTGSELSLSL